MKTKTKQTILAVVLVIVVAFGLIFALQKFTSLDFFDAANGPKNPPVAVIPEKGPNDGSGSVTNEVVEDLSKLSPEERCARMEGDAQLNCNDGLILKEVLASNMLLACNDLKYQPNVQYCQDVFYKNKALMDSDIKVCDEIKDEYIKTQCLDSLNLRISVRDGSIETCNQISDITQKNNCIDKIALKSAIANGDTNQCNGLNNETLKTLCVEKSSKKANTENYMQALADNNPILCNSLSENLKSECQDAVNYNIGVSKNDLNACKAIVDNNQQTECIANVYFAMAKQANDPSLCLKIGDTAKEKSCTQNVNVMLLKSALTTSDLNKCELISDATLKQKCKDSL